MLANEKIIVSADGHELPVIQYKITKPGSIHDNGTLQFYLTKKWDGNSFQRVEYEEVKEFINSDISAIKMIARLATAPNGYVANDHEEILATFTGYTKDPVIMVEQYTGEYILVLKQEKEADELAASEMQDIDALYLGIAEMYEASLN